MKRRRGAPGVVAEAGSDYGPSLRLGKDGRLRSWGGAVAVDIETRDDPTVADHRRLVRGARRRDVLIDLQSRRVISKRHVDAAEQFLEDCSIASGSTGGDWSGGGGSVAGPRAGLPERQVSAITRINHAALVLGLHDGTVFWWVVFQNGSIAAYEVANRLRSGSATDRLRRALTALDEHYHGRRPKRIA
jgi:hypothetical protein